MTVAKKEDGDYLLGMSQEEDPDIGRFQSRGEQNEPREPFVDPDEMLKKGREIPSFKSLHVPKGRMTKQGLKSFLVELKPFIEHIQQVSRDDQHKLGEVLQEVKKLVHEGKLAQEAGKDFDELVDAYARLLTHSEPSDQEKALGKIQELSQKLS